jgi:hypothetical protein
MATYFNEAAFLTSDYEKGLENFSENSLRILRSLFRQVK